MKPVNSFTRKTTCFQVTSYVFFSFLIIIYFFITLPLSNTLCKIIGGVLEFILGLVVLISGYVVSNTDTTDSIVKATLKAKHENTEYTPPVQRYYCASDSSFVTETSKHCVICQRCTEGFDHHCTWLNNDVGKANYKWFLVLIAALLSFLLVYLAMAITLTIHFSVDSILLQNDILMYNNSTHQIKPAMIVLWTSLVIAVGILVFDVSLVLLHLFLIKKGITTFQYIVLAEQRREYKREMEIARKALGEKERSFFDFVLCLGRRKRRKLKKDLNKVSAASSATSSEATLRGLSQSYSIDKATQNLENPEFYLRQEKRQDSKQFQGFDTEQNRKEKDIETGHEDTRKNSLYFEKSKKDSTRIPRQIGEKPSTKVERKHVRKNKSLKKDDNDGSLSTRRGIIQTADAELQSSKQVDSYDYKDDQIQRSSTTPGFDKLEDLLQEKQSGLNQSLPLENFDNAAEKGQKDSRDVSLIIVEDNLPKLKKGRDAPASSHYEAGVVSSKSTKAGTKEKKASSSNKTNS